MKSFRERSPLVVGGISLIALIVGVSLAFSINRFPALKGVYTVYADLEDAAGVRSGNEVRVAGVKVGQVTGLELTPEAARVKMEIGRDITLPSNVKVEVKLKTLLGQKFIDLQMPRSIIAGRENGAPSAGSGGSLVDGDVIPMDQTKIPFDIYQAATEGTAVLEEIDKDALRDLLNVLAGTVGRSADELEAALIGIDKAGKVLAPKSVKISRLLKHLEDLSGTLAGSSEDIDGLLARSAEVLTTLAEERTTLSSLLRATDDLGQNLGTLIQVARGDISVGFADLNVLLAGAEKELGSLDRALAEFGTAQRMFAVPATFGRFIEGSVCAATSEDTCVPDGSPKNPGLPVHGTQPEGDELRKLVP